MRMLSKTVVAFGLAGLMTLPAMAQQQQRRGPGGPGGGFGFGRTVSLGMLLSNKSVQDELKLDDAQKEKAREVAAKAGEKFRSSAEGLRDLDQAERAKKFQEMTREANAEARKAAGEFLKPEQQKRLREIALQTNGAAAFESPFFQNRLKLSDDQKKEISQTIEDSNKELRELFQSGDRQNAFAKVREHRDATLEKIKGKLNDEQKAEYAKLLGDPFELKFEGGPGARGEGGRRGPGAQGERGEGGRRGPGARGEGGQRGPRGQR